MSTHQELMQIDCDRIILQRLSSVPGAYSFSPYRMLVHLPEKIYQVFFEMAQMNEDKEYVKRCIQRDLLEWQRDRYPSYGIISVQDYSIDEAIEVSKKTGYIITWGMWIVLELNARTSFGTEVTHYIADSVPQIDRIP